MKTEISCIVCHTKIIVIPDDNKVNANYVVCENDHHIHIEPCLKMWLMSSESCPVCNAKYVGQILEKYSKKTQIEQILPVEEPHNEEEIEECVIIIDKLNRAKKLMLEQKYAASLNLLFDILDHDDPNNPDAKFLLGKAYFLSGRTDLSINTLMRLVKKHYSYPLAFYYLGKNFESIGLKDKALWAYERSRENLKQIIESPNQDALHKSKLFNVLEEVVHIIKEFSTK